MNFIRVWARHLNVLISVIYTCLIACLQIASWCVYLLVIRRFVWDLSSLPWAVVHTCVSAFFLISVAVNYVGCLVVRPSTPPRQDVESGSVPSIVEDEQNYLTKSQMQRICEPCGAPKPPRTHHCSTCRRCYVRLCHHCPSLGRCVARDNNPYFFRFVSHTFLGSLFAAATCNWLLNNWRTWGNSLDRKELNNTMNVLVLFMMGGLGVASATGVLAIWNTFLVSSGQTTIEWFDNFRVRRQGKAPAKWGRFGGPFSKDLRSNLQDALGVPAASYLPWWLVLLAPVARTPRD